MIERALNFAIHLQSDGATDTVELAISESPFWFIANDANSILSGSFDIAKLNPTAAVNMTSSTENVPEISSAIISGGARPKLTVVFASNVPAGVFNLKGTFIF